MRKIICKKGQVWVETVIYTLIGLAIIGLVMAAALPKINQKKDEIVIEQSIEALGSIDDKIYEVQRAAGSRRVIYLEVRKGALIFDLENDSILWKIDSSFPYSEVDMAVQLGRFDVTTRSGNPWEIELKIGYEIDLRYGEDNFGTKQLDSAPTPYKFIIENVGKDDDTGDIVISLSEA